MASTGELNAKVEGGNKRLSILRLIRSRGPLSRSELAAQLQLSKAAISSHVGALLDEGVCKEAGEVESSAAGRRAILLNINPVYRYIVGLDLGNSSPVLVLADLQKRIVAQSELDLPLEFNYEERLDFLRDGIESLLEKAAVKRQQVALFALSAPGIYNERDRSFYADGVFSDWRIGDLHDALAEHFAWPGYLTNDVNAASWGEYRFGSGDCRNMIYLGGSHGLGAGLIIDGHIYSGCSGRAGEISSLLWPLSLNEGRYGNISERCTLSGLLIRLRSTAPESSCRALGLSETECSKIRLTDIKSLARAGDPFVLERLMELSEMLGFTLCNMVLLLDCERVVLGGEFADFAQFILPRLSRMFEQYISSPPELKCSELGAYAGVYGLLELAEDRLFRQVSESLP